MRFHGGGVSHKVTHDWDSFLEGDYDKRMDGSPEEQASVSLNEGQREEAEDPPEVDGEPQREREEWDDDEQVQWDAVMKERDDESDASSAEGDVDMDEDKERTPRDDNDDGWETEEDNIYGVLGYGAL